MNKKKIIRIATGVLFLMALASCNRFDKNSWLASFGYNIDECEKRDRTYHSKPFASGRHPGRACIHYRRFMCRIERVCIGKSEIENEACRQEARNYWGQDERKPKICDNAPE